MDNVGTSEAELERYSHPGRLEDFIGIYPPQDDTEDAAYQEALSIAKINKQWADLNEEAVFNWLIQRTENIRSDK
ncbi:hypothetical protein LSH36_190g01044 [Paralvinella palmiformis]|uniref:Uncharacterized protein n=1 Tax=Paralvinella palmiformis TaxID=53620 RepID=A0AAD9JQS2_9ANNE|nr:hypothetical protein LSH36_190g01044 [Paralvinella palmiformis]